MSEAKPAKVHEAIARSLKDFGYPDVTADMIREGRKPASRSRGHVRRGPARQRNRGWRPDHLNTPNPSEEDEL
jgi:hypothetical protein